jgi:hypothetical protein
MNVVNRNIVLHCGWYCSWYIESSSSPLSEGEGEVHKAATSLCFHLQDSEGLDFSNKKMQHLRFPASTLQSLL